jgi:DNA invertase Pin-like site-specific DNA recombinase
MKIGYARVSTQCQNLDLQLDALNKLKCDKVFEEKVSGKDTNRPQFLLMNDQLRKGDTVVIWKLDRLGRNFNELIQIIEDWKKREIALKVLTENFDTSTPEGELYFRIFCMIADYERAKIRERINAGLKAARARGRVGGKPPALQPKEVDRLKKLYVDNELSISELSDMFKVGKTTIYKYVNK